VMENPLASAVAESAISLSMFGMAQYTSV
jgi:hypothetical protein